MSQQPNMEEILIDYLDGTLDATRRRAVETLLKHDAKLRKALRAMRQVRGALHDLPIEPMPAAAASSLQEQLRPPAEPSILLYSRPWLIRLAAAFAMAVTAGLVIWSMLPSPMDRHPVAMTHISSPALNSVALDTRKDSGATQLGDTMEPGLSLRGGAVADQLQAGGVASENEPTLVVVVADDIGGTERQIRNLLTLNNINYESVPAGTAERDEAAKEVQARGGAVVADAAREAAASASAEARADIEQSEAKTSPQVTAAPAAAAPSAMAAGPAPAGPATPAAPPAQLAQRGRTVEMGGGAGGPGMARGAERQMPQALASAKPTAQQSGPAQRRSQAATGRTTPEPYGMVVARNVTPDQLGRIRSGLRDASRSGNMRVVDPSADRFPQAADKNQALNRAQQTETNRQQVQKQNAWQYSNSQAIQNTQEQEQLALQNQNGPQRPISYSARYDVTIVVQSEDAASAATLPAQASPATMPAATAPSTAPSKP